MALNAGEVEVLLKLRDELSAQLKAVKEGLKTVGTDSTSVGKQVQSSWAGLGDVVDNAGNRIAAAGAVSVDALQKQYGQTVITAKEMEKLGIQGSKGMQDVAKETKDADKANASMMGTIKTLAGTFAAMFTARAAFNFAAQTIAEASALSNLSKQTRINVEDLQVLGAASKDFGIGTDELGRSLFKLSKGIASGDESVVHGLRLMGMQLKDVEGLEGEELFLKIMSGLSTLQGGLRDTAATDLFGSKIGMAMAGAAEGMQTAVDKARQLNTVMSQESVDALKAYGKAIDTAKGNLANIAANLMGPVAEGFNTVNDAVVKGASKWSIFVAMTKDWASSNSVTGASTEHLTRLLDGLNKKTEENAASTKKATDASRERAPALTEEGRIAKFMTDLQAEGTEELTATQKKNLATLKELNQLTVQNAKDIGVSAEQFAKYTADVTKAEEAEKKMVAALEKSAEAFEELRSSGDGWKGTLATIDPMLVSQIQKYLDAGVAQGTLATAYGLTATQIKAVAKAMSEEAEQLKIEQKMLVDTEKMWSEYNMLKVQHGSTALKTQLAQIKQWADEQALAARQAGITDKSYYDALEALSKEKSKSLMVDWDAIASRSKSALQETADKAQATFQHMLANADQFSVETIDEFWKTAEAAQRAADGWDTAFSGALDSVGQKVAKATMTWSEAMDAARKGEGTMTGTLNPQNNVDSPEARAEILKASAEKRYYGPVDQNGMPDFKRIFPSHEDGGPTKEGPAYVHDGEYVVPKNGVLVMAGSGSGSGAGKTMSVQLVLADGTEIARAVVPWLPGELRRIGVA